MTPKCGTMEAQVRNPTMPLIQINSRAVHGFSFTSLALARSFASRCHKPHRIMLGDHPCYWVVSPADAECLARAGYECAE